MALWRFGQTFNAKRDVTLDLVVGKINFTATDNRHIQLGLRLVW